MGARHSLVAVAAALGVGLAIAARPLPTAPSAPDCGDAALLRASPLYAEHAPAPADPTAAVAALLDAGIGDPALASLELEVARGVDDQRDDAVTVHGALADGRGLLARVVPHPAGGWRVDLLLACASPPGTGTASSAEPGTGGRR